MDSFNQYKKKLVVGLLIIIFIVFGTPFWLLAQNQGVVVDQAGRFRFRQELRPFIPIQGDFSLDPSRGEIILLFPKDEIKKIIQPSESEVKTEKRVFRKTNIKTQTETTTGTVTSTTK